MSGVAGDVSVGVGSSASGSGGSVLVSGGDSGSAVGGRVSMLGGGGVLGGSVELKGVLEAAMWAEM